MGSYENSDHIFHTNTAFNAQGEKLSGLYENDSTETNNGKVESNEETKATSGIKTSLISFTWGVLASLMIAAGTVFVQLLEGAVPDFQLAFMRSFLHFLFPLFYFCYKRRLPRVRTKLWPWVFCYCIFFNIFQITNYIAVNYIAAGVASCIRRSVNIVGIAILAAVLLKERLTLPKCIGVSLSIVGVIMCVQPWYDHTPDSEPAKYTSENRRYLSSLLNHLKYYGSEFGSRNESSNVTTIEPENDGNDSLDSIIGYVLATAAGVAASFSNITIKFRLGELSASTLNVYCGAFGFVVSLVISLATEDLAMPSEALDIFYVFAQGVFWALSTVFGVRAVCQGSVVLVTLAFSLQIVFLLVAQYTILSHIDPGVGNWVEILGAILVVVAAVLPSAWEAIELKLRSKGKCQDGCLGICFAPKKKKTYEFKF